MCKKCLLLEAGNRAAYQSVKDCINDISDELKTDKMLYDRRLALCGACDSLIAGMCLLCGCYVEMRAAYKDKSCPDPNNRKW